MAETRTLVVDSYPLTTAAQLPILPGTPQDVIERDFMLAFETGRTRPEICLRNPFPGGNMLHAWTLVGKYDFLRIGDEVVAEVIPQNPEVQKKCADIIVGRVSNLLTINGIPRDKFRSLDRQVWPEDWGKNSGEMIRFRGFFGALLYTLGAAYMPGMKLTLVGFQNTGKSATAGQLMQSLPEDYELIVATTGEREEEAFDYTSLKRARVLAISAHKTNSAQLRVAELAIQMAKRRAEIPGRKVFLLVDSVTQLVKVINKFPTEGLGTRSGAISQLVDGYLKVILGCGRYSSELGSSLTVMVAHLVTEKMGLILERDLTSMSRGAVYLDLAQRIARMYPPIKWGSQSIRVEGAEVLTEATHSRVSDYFYSEKTAALCTQLREAVSESFYRKGDPVYLQAVERLRGIIRQVLGDRDHLEEKDIQTIHQKFFPSTTRSGPPDRRPYSDRDARNDRK